MIGFVIPTKLEAQELIAALVDRTEASVRGRTISRGSLNGQECAVVISGIGKVLCAAATQLLLDLHECGSLIHLGTAGALSDDVRKGQIVIGREIESHDHFSAFSPRSEKPRAISDRMLVEGFRAHVESQGVACHVGKILSGDEDVLTLVRRHELFAKYHGLAVDWESYACAKICNLNGVPCLVARAITDQADEDTLADFQTEARRASARLCRLVTGYLLPGERT